LFSLFVVHPVRGPEKRGENKFVPAKSFPQKVLVSWTFEDESLATIFPEDSVKRTERTRERMHEEFDFETYLTHGFGTGHRAEGTIRFLKGGGREKSPEPRLILGGFRRVSSEGGRFREGPGMCLGARGSLPEDRSKAVFTFGCAQPGGPMDEKKKGQANLQYTHNHPATIEIRQ